jgi:hypothetical protein
MVAIAADFSEAAIKTRLARQFRCHVMSQFYDDSGTAPAGTAIYLLSDPREIRRARYVGLTKAPRRRFLQHLAGARLWLPDLTPWWIESPRLRPLYSWIRELYRDGSRLPTMVIDSWAETSADARVLERRRIYECLALQLPLFNVEAERPLEQAPVPCAVSLEI